MRQQIEGLTTKNITINGRKIRYYQGGKSGPEILLIHGGAIDSAKLSWGVVAPILAQSMKVTAIDLPGFGSSEPPRGSVTVSFYSSFITKFLSEIGVTKTAVAGFGIGGQIAMSLAVFNPELVTRIHLLASGGLLQSKLLIKARYLLTRTPKLTFLSAKLLGRSQKIFKTYIRAMFFNHENVTDDFMMNLIQDFRNTPALETYTKFCNNEMFKDGRRSDLIPMMTGTKIPTMIIHGQFDLTFPPILAQEAAQRIQTADLRIIPKCGHWVSRDRPETVAAFLSETVH